MRKLILVVCLSLGIIISGGNCLAKDPEVKSSNVINKSMGQTVYLSLAHLDLSYDPGDGQILYNYIFNRMIIRNTDPNNQIAITSLEIYDPSGNFIIDLLDPNRTNKEDPKIPESAISLNPLASTSYGIPSEIPRNDGTISGRHCALVTWQANDYVIHPRMGTAFVWSEREGNGWRRTAFGTTGGKIIE